MAARRRTMRRRGLVPLLLLSTRTPMPMPTKALRSRAAARLPAKEGAASWRARLVAITKLSDTPADCRCWRWCACFGA